MVRRLYRLPGESSKLEYSNPEIPEGINTSKLHPLKEFIWLTSGVAAFFITIIIVLILFSDFLTSYIPFSVEQKISPSVINNISTEGPLSDYLQALADKITVAEELPNDMVITVHYLNDDTVNAFATLGGHVFLFRGLLEKLSSENALAMLLAHEIAHIKHRHPIRSLGRGVIISLALSIIGSGSSDTINEGFLGEAGFLTIMKYSRDMEQEADNTAIKALVLNYGHLTGAVDLFSILQNEDDGVAIPEFFKTHPLSKDRLDIINKYSKVISPTIKNKITALPKLFSQWLAQKTE
jgi:predicted Zn-dependent protease